MCISGARAQEEEAVEAAAREAVTSELQRRASARAAWQLASRRSALEWLRHPVPASTAEYVADWLGLLRDALAALYPHAAVQHADGQLKQEPMNGTPAGGSVPEDEAVDPALASIAAAYLSEEDGNSAGARASGSPGLVMEEGNSSVGAGGSAHTAGSPQVGALVPALMGSLGDAQVPNGGHALPVGLPRRTDPLALTEVLDALRELGSLHMTLALFSTTDVLPTFRSLTDHQVCIGSYMCQGCRLQLPQSLIILHDRHHRVHPTKLSTCQLHVLHHDGPHVV
jgi:hypothetical protein